MSERFDMIIPLWMRAVAVAAILSILAGLGWWIHHTIYKQGYNAAKAEYVIAAENERLANQEEIDGLAKSFAIKAAKQRSAVLSNASKVEKYAPSNAAPLPGSFRVWHDAHAEGKALDDSSGITGASVSLKDTSTTVADNYTSCNYDKYRLSILQEIVKTMNEERDGKEKD